MPPLTPSAVRKQIAGGSVDPVYLVAGDDELEKSALAAEFANLIEEDLRAFNVERIHAGEWTSGDRLVDGVGSIVAAARTLPMMTPRRVVIVLQCETLLAPKRESEAATRGQETLENLIKDPETQTALVFVASSVDKRGRMALPAAAAAGILWLALRFLIGPGAFVPAAAVAAAILVVETVVVTELLGPMYERLDALDVERAE